MELQKQEPTLKLMLRNSSASGTEINAILKKYKLPTGAVNYPELFKVAERLPEMAKSDLQGTTMLINAGLTQAMKSMNLVRPMSGQQVLDLADAIIDTASEDNLSLEDLMLFLQKLVRGEYGPMYEGMDIPKFMDKFELYREERFQAIQNIRYEESIQHKTLPVNDRIADLMPDDERNLHRKAATQYLIDNAKKP